MDKKTSDIIQHINEAEGSVLLQPLGKARTDVREGLSSGSLNLNYALAGNPLIGYAFGRIVEVIGEEGSGKTTLALHAVREAQRRGFPCVYLDAEHTVDPDYAERLGVDIDNIAFSQPDWGEQAITVVRRAVEAGAKLIVVDSVAALVPKAELEGDTGDAFMGKHARLMSQAMRQLNGRISKAKAIVIFINQTRQKIGVFFGDPTTTTGGKALRFYASYRLFVSSPRSTAEKEKVEGETLETGIDMNIVVRKNKLYPPYRKATVHIDYGKGINLYEDAASFLVTHVGSEKKVKVGNKVYSQKRLAEALQNDGKVRAEVNKILGEFQQ